MITNVVVKCQIDAEEYCQQHHDEKSVMISITSPNTSANVFTSKENNVQEILRLNFDDVDIHDDIKFRDLPWFEQLMKNGTYISSEQAELIAIFVNQWMEWMGEDVTLIVHCEGGVSRSAGVAAAVLKAYYDNDSYIFDSRLYCPNMTVYRKVLDAIYLLNPCLISKFDFKK